MQNQIFKRILTQSNQIRTSYPTSALRSTQFQFQSSSSSNFSTSTRFNAREADRGSFEAPYSEASVPLYDRLAMHPEALQAIEDLARLAKEKTGVDLASGAKPTMKMMLQLAQDTELKAAAERLMAALKAAGISVDPHQALEALKTMGGEGFNNVGKDGKGEDDK